MTMTKVEIDVPEGEEEFEEDMAVLKKCGGRLYDVVSDTTPIISLIKAGQLELLQKLFHVVCIPETVFRELTENKAYLEEAGIVQECKFLHVEKVKNEKSVVILRKFTGLDAGESETIILADEKQTDILLMDEVAACSWTIPKNRN